MKNILIIDDEDDFRVMLTLMLQKAGYAVTAAPDGLQGMKEFEKRHPDLMVTDIFMPEKEGLSTIMDAKKADPAVKIIAMSGGGRVWNMDSLPAALSLGADAVLYKPFRQEEFLGLIRQLLAPTVR
jgi:DNA-binding response OmpR family regulator